MKCHIMCAGLSESLARTSKATVTQCLRVLPLLCHPEGGARRISGRSSFAQRRMTSLTICAVPDAEMMRMNRQFRGKNKTTDVLTFVYPDLVEIYISLPVARRQAKRRCITLAQECQRLVVHGLCHAAGMDHHTLSGFQEMRRREFEVLVQCAID